MSADPMPRPVSYRHILEKPVERTAVAHHSPESDVWQMAVLMGERYGVDATLESAVLAEHLLADGDWQAAEMWHRIRDAIEWLQATAPAPGEPVH